MRKAFGLHMMVINLINQNKEEAIEVLDVDAYLVSRDFEKMMVCQFNSITLFLCIISAMGIVSIPLVF